MNSDFVGIFSAQKTHVPETNFAMAYSNGYVGKWIN